MSYSDNIYSSIDGSDSASFSEELSPTNGYFNRNDMPPNMVPDPGLERRQNVETKDEEAAGEATSTYTTNRSSSDTSQPSTSAPLVEKSQYTPPSASGTGDLYSNFASTSHQPPSYFTTIASSPGPSEDLHSGRGYSSFTNRLEEGLITSREPESMGEPADEPTERTPLRRNEKKSSPRRKVIRHILAFALVLAILLAVGIQVSHFRILFNHHDSHVHPPTGRPVDDTGPCCPFATIPKGELTLEVPMRVHDTITIQQLPFEVNGRQSGQRVSTTGEIRVRKLARGSKYGHSGYFSLDVRVSHPDLNVTHIWDGNLGVLKFSTPKFVDLDSSGPHWICIGITAWVPEDATLEQISIDAITLSLRIFEDVTVKVSKMSHFSTVAGYIQFMEHNQPVSVRSTIHEVLSLPQVHTPTSETSASSASSPRSKFDSRRISVGTISGSIHGTLPLYDLLQITSQSGSVDVQVTPQPVSPSAPAAANLLVHTISGSIQVSCPITNPNYNIPRNYTTKVESVSGSIDGRFYIGSNSEFRTMSGSVSLDTLPIIEKKSEKNNFQTETNSGTTSIRMLEPIFFRQSQASPVDYITSPSSKRDKLRNLSSSHSSTSGGFQVHYPSAWEGNIGVTTMSGSISITGKGVKIIDEERNWFTVITARKGVSKKGEGSSVSLQGMSGHTDLTVGNS